MKKKMLAGLVVIFLSLTGFTLESSSELVTVSGFCRSAGGSAISGVNISMQNISTGDVYSASSDNLGFYSAEVDANSTFNCTYTWGTITKQVRNSSGSSSTSFQDVIF